MVSDDGILIGNFSIDDLPNDILKGVYQYWLDIKGDHAMPSRADLHPADIVSLLPYVSLIDVEHDTQRYKMRLIGTETVKALGKEITGKYLDELGDIEGHLKPRYDWIVHERRPYLISDRLLWAEKSYMNFCSIGLPLSQDGQNVDIILYGSCFEFPDEI
ncbi:MAG: hypothetical protein COA81_08275 [Alphaproteobacteria bacterium]|nr:MAG: hypothetical protein COA81_08275 [Alphaproteobacteria bacterium]